MPHRHLSFPGHKSAGAEQGGRADPARRVKAIRAVSIITGAIAITAIAATGDVARQPGLPR